ncbi:hypothetical protein BDV32DRAFT_132341 [Aspergillus pseudonomiae]|uniref:Uncharacterized protein n=1 Tax=Aspergillus pseudonomiae TaxID=1506151 RepID=A0A5N6HJ87_9EURO|nr:uncharacterized protein BDV37DRAFT_265852 [Aspergillus pseudonomiae]KAB8254496.1 hypothetical protein BDV32DRAFT_132341 [Aspergillus pseudonomiae]KAE8397335.1 hypothetical protein BDV37DRAFT_265852 [Aspergillus pseudonomiae]
MAAASPLLSIDFLLNPASSGVDRAGNMETLQEKILHQGSDHRREWLFASHDNSAGCRVDTPKAHFCPMAMCSRQFDGLDELRRHYWAFHSRSQASGCLRGRSSSKSNDIQNRYYCPILPAPVKDHR